MSSIQPVNQPPQNPQQLTVNSGHAPCPGCRASSAVPVGYTWWGGIVGPRIFHVVRCLQCGTQYNGKSGESLTKSILIFNGVILGIAIVVGIIVATMR